MTSDAAVTAGSPAAPVPGRRPVLFAVWTLVLAMGFGLVLTLGGPIPSAQDDLAAAYALTPPVDEAAAVRSADTIARLEYPAISGGERTVTRRTDFGVDRFVVVYTRPDARSLLRVSVVVDTGEVSVSYVP